MGGDMKQVWVAFGEERARIAEEKDPEGKNKNCLIDTDRTGIWNIYEFKTDAEAEAFLLGVSESSGWLENYAVKK
jgi:hypothetical protein